MSQQTIKGTPKLADAIRIRRKELGLTIEQAASKANVGTKTWCRYEAGASIRKDKARGIMKALNWKVLPIAETKGEHEVCLEEYRTHKAWSNYISECYGEAAAISFVIGSDLLLDCLQEDMTELSALPRGTHVGQLPVSNLADILPPQFLVRYDYEFLYSLRATILKLREVVHYAQEFAAHSVMQELALYLITKESEFLMECMSDQLEACGVSGAEDFQGWIFDLFEDMDIVTCLYSDDYLRAGHSYNYDRWMEEQFFV